MTPRQLIAILVIVIALPILSNVYILYQYSVLWYTMYYALCLVGIAGRFLNTLNRRI